MSDSSNEEFEDWQMIPWLVGLGGRLKRLDGHEPREIQQIIKLLRQLDGKKMVGYAMKHWDGYVFGRTEFDDGQGVPASLLLHESLEDDDG